MTDKTPTLVPAELQAHADAIAGGDVVGHLNAIVFSHERLAAEVYRLTAERERADHAERILRETSELLGDAGVPGGTTIAGGVIFLRERADRAESIVREITDENANDRNALGSCIEVVRIAKEALTPTAPTGETR
jgi:biotin carboxylase